MVWVVICEQSYANHWRLVGGFDDHDEAVACLERTIDGVLYECDGEDYEEIARRRA